MTEFFTISLLLMELSGTYVRFRKQSQGRRSHGGEEDEEEKEEKEEEEEEKEVAADRFDSVTSQAKRTEEKRKSHASEGQKQHGSSSGSIERSDRSIPGITQTCARVIRERAGKCRA